MVLVCFCFCLIVLLNANLLLRCGHKDVRIKKALKTNVQEPPVPVIVKARLKMINYEHEVQPKKEVPKRTETDLKTIRQPGLLDLRFKSTTQATNLSKPLPTQRRLPPLYSQKTESVKQGSSEVEEETTSKHKTFRKAMSSPALLNHDFQNTHR